MVDPRRPRKRPPESLKRRGGGPKPLAGLLDLILAKYGLRPLDAREAQRAARRVG